MAGAFLDISLSLQWLCLFFFTTMFGTMTARSRADKKVNKKSVFTFSVKTLFIIYIVFYAPPAINLLRSCGFTHFSSATSMEIVLERTSFASS